METTNSSKTLRKNTNLYRYDLTDNTPKNWSTDVHSVEYSTGRGYKNNCGAFFFFDNITAAEKLCEKAKKEANIQTSTITSCHTTKDLTFLNLSEYENPSQMICNLYEKGIDIFNKGFVKFGEDPTDDASIDVLKEAFVKVLNTSKETKEGLSIITQYSQKINDFFDSFESERKGHACRYICQLLTDFDNGPIFKKMLLEKGFDGYCFREDPGSLTYCIFDSHALSSPERDR